MAKRRDYAAEYRRRNQLAQSRGYKSYAQQRRVFRNVGGYEVWKTAPPIERTRSITTGHTNWLHSEENYEKFLDTQGLDDNPISRRSFDRLAIEADIYYSNKRKTGPLATYLEQIGERDEEADYDVGETPYGKSA